MLVTPIQTDNAYSNEALNCLIDQIDAKILCLSLDELNSIRYSTKTQVSLEDYESLSFYKDILKSKMLGCNCLENYQVDYMVSSIKKLLNKINC